MKISAKEKKILILLGIIILSVIIFMYVLKPLMDKTAEKRVTLDGLKGQQQEYNDKILGLDTIDTDTLKEMAQKESLQPLLPEDLNDVGVSRFLRGIIDKIKNDFNIDSGEYPNSNNLVSGSEKVVTKPAAGKNPDETVTMYYYEAKMTFLCGNQNNAMTVIKEIQKERSLKIFDASGEFKSGDNGKYTLELKVRCFVKYIEKK